MTPADVMRIFGARLAQAREERRAKSRERRRERWEIDALLAAADRALDEKERREKARTESAAAWKALTDAVTAARFDIALTEDDAVFLDEARVSA